MTKAQQRKSPEFMKEISFSELVKAINEKWSHTYGDVDDQGNEVR